MVLAVMTSAAHLYAIILNYFVNWMRSAIHITIPLGFVQLRTVGYSISDMGIYYLWSKL